MASACAICHTRRPKRQCPGIGGDICTICCGREREVTVDCRLECRWLHEAYSREDFREDLPEPAPDAEGHVTQAFLDEHEPLMMLLAAALAQGAILADHARDSDMREALEALTRIWRGRQNGLVVEVRPENPIAATVVDAFERIVREVRTFAEQQGETTRDADIFRLLVFLQRIALQMDNGRPKTKKFIAFTLGFLPPLPDEDPQTGPPGGGIIVP